MKCLTQQREGNYLCATFDGSSGLDQCSARNGILQGVLLSGFFWLQVTEVNKIEMKVVSK